MKEWRNGEMKEWRNGACRIVITICPIAAVGAEYFPPDISTLCTIVVKTMWYAT
jgi:hypothetical protein